MAPCPTAAAARPILGHRQGFILRFLSILNSFIKLEWLLWDVNNYILKSHKPLKWLMLEGIPAASPRLREGDVRQLEPPRVKTIFSFRRTKLEQKKKHQELQTGSIIVPLLLLLLLNRFSRVRFCATPQTAAHQAPPSLGFSRQEHWSGLPIPSPMHGSEK